MGPREDLKLGIQVNKSENRAARGEKKSLEINSKKCNYIESIK